MAVSSVTKPSVGASSGSVIDVKRRHERAVDENRRNALAHAPASVARACTARATRLGTSIAAKSTNAIAAA